jgi:hypothetical protein
VDTGTVDLALENDEAERVCSQLSEQGVRLRFKAAFRRVQQLEQQLLAHESEEAQVESVIRIVKAQTELLEQEKPPGPFFWDQLGDISSASNFHLMERIARVTSRAPVLVRILREGVLGRPPNDPGSARYSTEYYWRGLFAALAALMKIRNERCSFLPTLLGMYMMAHHVGKKVFSLFNRLGVSNSFEQASAAIVQFKGFNQSRVHEMMSGERWQEHAITFDNINMHQKVVEQLSASKSQMLSATVAMVAPLRRKDPTLSKHVPQIALSEHFDVSQLSPLLSDHAVLKRYGVGLIHNSLLKRLGHSFESCPSSTLDSAQENAADLDTLPVALRGSALHFVDTDIDKAQARPAMLPLLPCNEAETTGMLKILTLFRAAAEHADVEGHSKEI